MCIKNKSIVNTKLFRKDRGTLDINVRMPIQPQIRMLKYTFRFYIQ